MGDFSGGHAAKFQIGCLNIGRALTPVTLPCSAEFSAEPFKKNPHRNHFFSVLTAP